MGKEMGFWDFVIAHPEYDEILPQETKKAVQNIRTIQQQAFKDGIPTPEAIRFICEHSEFDSVIPDDFLKEIRKNKEDK